MGFMGFGMKKEQYTRKPRKEFFKKMSTEIHIPKIDDALISHEDTAEQNKYRNEAAAKGSQKYVTVFFFTLIIGCFIYYISK